MTAPNNGFWVLYAYKQAMRHQQCLIDDVSFFFPHVAKDFIFFNAYIYIIVVTTNQRTFFLSSTNISNMLSSQGPMQAGSRYITMLTALYSLQNHTSETSPKPCLAPCILPDLWFTPGTLSCWRPPIISCLALHGLPLSHIIAARHDLAVEQPESHWFMYDLCFQIISPSEKKKKPKASSCSHHTLPCSWWGK